VLELVEKETLAKDDLERILAPVRKRPPHNTFTAFGKRTPSDRPPIDIPVALRKPSPNGSANGSRNGSHGEGNGSSGEGGAQPGVVPGTTGPQPAAPGSGGVFGPQDGSAGQPYGGFPPPPPTSYDAPSGGGQG
jgi:cell division protease FtsH